MVPVPQPRKRRALAFPVYVKLFRCSGGCDIEPRLSRCDAMGWSTIHSQAFGQIIHLNNSLASIFQHCDIYCKPQIIISKLDENQNLRHLSNMEKCLDKECSRKNVNRSLVYLLTIFSIFFYLYTALKMCTKDVVVTSVGCLYKFLKLIICV